MRNPTRSGPRIVLMLLVLGLGASMRAGAGEPTAAEAAFPNTEPIADGPFKADWESLRQYHTPDWFRDAKFGIWAHWTAQCVPEQGDWYARKMYISSDPKTGKPDPDYLYHMAHYGHPSQVGFKEIDRLWHAEHWEPEALIDLYKRAGARYFVALANHHDNFDCYDSKYQPWNSVQIGPERDIVGTWAKAARAAGLRFGVSVHASHAWSWFEVAQGADKDGPLAGVPYDGTLTKEDGKGTWWEGLDPQDLYAQDHAPGEKLMWDWDATHGSVPDEAYCRKFFNRTIDLINKYQPDLLYFDDTVLPLHGVSDEYGLRIAAHFYNSSMRWHDGRNEAVMNGKRLDADQRRCLVLDIERGLTREIEPFAWQTDTCIGQWHYRRSLFEHHGYKKPELVIHMLADIVSKNGNLLLSIPLRGDGTIDADEVAFLKEMARWMDVNGECIFGTRPWEVYGEGPSTEVQPEARKGGDFNEDKQGYTPRDIRFTTRGDVVYAIALGWPDDGTLTVKSLAPGSGHGPADIAGIELLGSDARIEWKRTDAGLEIVLPAQKPCDHAYAFKILPAPAR